MHASPNETQISCRRRPREEQPRRCEARSRLLLRQSSAAGADRGVGVGRAASWHRPEWAVVGQALPVHGARRSVGQAGLAGGRNLGAVSGQTDIAVIVAHVAHLAQRQRLRADEIEGQRVLLAGERRLALEVRDIARLTDAGQGLADVARVAVEPLGAVDNRAVLIELRGWTADAGRAAA